MLLTLLIFIAILALLVLAHEFGHFIVARRSGVKVEEFGFGFPPRIFGVQILKGEKMEKVAEKEDLNIQYSISNISEAQPVIVEKIEDKIREIDVFAPVRKWRFVWGSGRHLEDSAAPDNREWLNAGTVYSLNWIPLGGFVKIKGETGEFANESDSFSYQRIGSRAWILAAGVLMNFVLAGLLLSIGFGIGLPQSLDEVGRGAKVKDPKVEILAVLDDSPASQVGLQVGDEIIQVDALAGLALAEVQNYVDGKKGQPVKWTFRRGSETLEKTIIPTELAATKKGGIGVALLESGRVSYPWHLAFYKGFEAMFLFSWEVVKALWFLLANLIHGAGVTENLSGPVGIAVLTGRVARLGFIYLLQFTAMLSINLAVLNFLPFPALDGGRILFLIIEKLRGRPVQQKIEQIVHTVGFALLMVLVVLVTYRDAVRFSGSFARLGKRLIGD